MINIRTRRPPKRYFASANPPRLLSVTTLTVYADARKSEFTIQTANGSCAKSVR